jgi:hypothetical protein
MIMTVDGFYTVPKDRANWLFEVDLDALGVKWLCLRRYGCYALFVQGNGRAEAHWTCLPRVDVWNALRFCQEVLPVAKKILGVPKFYGLTPVSNLQALKMARLLKFRPLGFSKFNNIVCLVSVKEFDNG